MQDLYGLSDHFQILCIKGLKYSEVLTLSADPTKFNELFECVWPFYGVGAQKVKNEWFACCVIFIKLHNLVHFENVERNAVSCHVEIFENDEDNDNSDDNG